MNMNRLKESSISALTLFTSAGTLVCCALPILFVTLGMGAAVVSLTNTAPWLVSLSERKEWVFLVSFFMILLCTWFIYRPNRACPADPKLAIACAQMDLLNRWIYWISVAVWLVGFFSAFLLLPMTQWLEG